MEKEKRRKRQELKKLVEKSIIRDEEKKRLHWSATSPINEVLMVLNSSLDGLDDAQIRRNRSAYGKNDEKTVKKGMIQQIFRSRDQQLYHVIRKDQDIEDIPGEELVVGDIVYLSKGEPVPADLRLIESEGLTVEQSALTENMTPVKKKAGVCMGELDQVTDYFNIMLMGTNITEGKGKAIVVSVGDHTITGTMK